MVITPVEILISLNVVWISLVSSLGILVYRLLKGKIDKLESDMEFLKNEYTTVDELKEALNGIGKRIDNEICREDLKAKACRGELDIKISALNQRITDFESRFTSFLRSYNHHVHSDSGRVEGGDFI